MGLGEALALAAPMAWGLAVVLFRRSGESMPPFELNLCKNALAGALMLVTVLAVYGLELPSFTAREYGLMVASGLLGMAVADTWYFRALNLLGAGRAGIIGSLLSPFVILLSALFLGERLTPWQWAGFALVMLGILLVTWRRRRREVSSEELRMGVGLGVAAVFLMAVGVVMVKEILETRPFLWVVEWRLLGGVAGMLVVLTLRRRWGAALAVYRAPHPWRMTLFASFLGGYLAMILWLGGYRLLPASVASIYNEAQASFIVLFAWLILREPMEGRKLAGLGFTIAGVAVMLLV
ncbi:MAG: DMT family transporter [Gammaproteobacteria bacterium]